MENGRAYGVAYRSARGQEGRAYAPMIIDASGRDTLLASRLRLKRKDSTLNKVSVFAHFTGVRRDPGPDEGNLIIALFRHGWFWIIPLAGKRTSVGVVVDASYAKAWPGGMAALFAGERTVAKQHLFSAIAQLPEHSAWHHLGRLYLTLAQMS